MSESKSNQAWWRFEVHVYINGDLCISAQFHKKKHAKIFLKCCSSIFKNVTLIEVPPSCMPF